MKFAILGGSFNPIHNGHIKLAEAALAEGCGRVIFIPACQSPFKAEYQADNAGLRAAMLLASMDRPEFGCDLGELQRGGLSYTIDTVKDFIERYTPEDKPALLLGDDIIKGYSLWRGAEEIAKLCTLTIAHRYASQNDANKNIFDNFLYPHKRLQNSIVHLSSTTLRNAIAEGGVWQDLVPAGAREIIETHGLYGAPRRPPAPLKTPDFSALSLNSIASIEAFVRGTLNVERFAHSRNVALHCYDLAERFGLDKTRAYIAGLLHDVCKELSREKMTQLSEADGAPFTSEENKKWSLLHGRAAAVFLASAGLNDDDVLQAVRMHTIGGAELCPLAKIVYLSDKIETGRGTVERRLRLLAFGPTPCTDLDSLYDQIYTATRAYLHQNGIV